MTYGVVTHVSPPEEGGNLYNAIDIYVRASTDDDGYGEGPYINIVESPFAETMVDAGLNLLDMMMENFQVGELLILNSNGRDQFGRKPSKWDVAVQEFDTIEEARDLLEKMLSETEGGYVG